MVGKQSLLVGMRQLTIGYLNQLTGHDTEKHRVCPRKLLHGVDINPGAHFSSDLSEVPEHGVRDSLGAPLASGHPVE